MKMEANFESVWVSLGVTHGIDVTREHGGGPAYKLARDFFLNGAAIGRAQCQEEILGEVAEVLEDAVRVTGIPAARIAEDALRSYLKVFLQGAQAGVAMMQRDAKAAE